MATYQMSKNQAKRLIKQGAVDVNGKTVLDPNFKIKPGDKIKVGKKGFYTVVENKNDRSRDKR